MTKHKQGKGNGIRLEHIGLNVHNPEVVADWYCTHLGMKVIRKRSPNIIFLADAGDHMMFELYDNPRAPILDYASMELLSMHLAFLVDNVEEVRARLIAAGASPIGEITTNPSGDTLANLRDPWGIAIQFIKRVEPMLPV